MDIIDVAVRNRYLGTNGYYKLYLDNGVVVEEHRYLVSNHLKRELSSNEVVHHKDGNKKNNDLDNLEVVSPSEHINLHRKPRTFYTLECGYCGVIFKKEARQFRHKHASGQSIFFCSRSCGARGRRGK